MKKYNKYWSNKDYNYNGNKKELSDFDNKYIELIIKYDNGINSIDNLYMNLLEKELKEKINSFKQVDEYNNGSNTEYHIIFNKDIGNITAQKKKIERVTNTIKKVIVMLEKLNNNIDIYDYQNYIYSLNLEEKISNTVYKDLYQLSKDKLK